MDIDDFEQLDNITNYVANIRNNDEVFIPTDMTNNDNKNNYNGNNSVQQQHIAYLIVDTNFILSHLSLLNELEKLLHSKYMGVYQIVIPKQVIHELDGLKDADKSFSHSSNIESKHSMSNLARSAIDWCYSHFHDSIPTVTGQRLHERIDKNAIKDNAILDCCLYFQNIENNGNNMAVLLSNDKNLCVKALVNNILTISYRQGMNAELIASNILNELINNYNFNPNINIDTNNNLNNNNNVNNNDNEIFDQSFGNDTMEIEPSINEFQSSNPIESKEITFDEIKEEIYSQVTTLVLEAIKYAVESIFGDASKMVGYNDDRMNSLLDAARCIVKMGVSTFSEFFDRRKFNPMKMLQDRETMKLFVNKPEDRVTIKEFIAFWSEFLEGIYKDRDLEQKSALKQISDHWQNLIKKI